MDNTADEESTAATGPAFIRTRRPTVSSTQPLGSWFLLFGVVLPAITILIELVTHCCAETLFDPIPTLWHTALIVLVPLANLLIYRDTQRDEPASRWLAILAGTGIAISLYYTVLFAPVTPIAGIGIIWFGLGLLPLAAIFSFIAILRATFKSSYKAWPKKMTSRIMIGFALGSLTLGVLEIPNYFTRAALYSVVKGDPDSRDSSIKRLRNFGSRDTLLRACYESFRSNNGTVDTTGWLAGFTGLNSVGNDEARRVYFKVTGKAFNSAEPPNLRSRSEFDLFDEFSFDDGQGGDAVGLRLAHLHLENSRIDTHIDPISALAYTEWTLVFQNRARNQAEARFQTLLPPDGVVSRLTLWVNGEPQEAAFAATSKVKAAYKNVVQVQRRDPVLVTSTGPDRVLVQCFPVPPNGGEIKIRLGITSPLQPDSKHPDKATNWIPRIIERNFNIAKKFEHALWVQSPDPLATSLPGLDPEIAESGKAHALTGTLSHRIFNVPSASITASGLRPGTAVWAEDPFEPGTAIIREPGSGQNGSHQHLVITLDTSAGMAPDWGKTKAVILSFAQKHSTTLVLADDEPTAHEGPGEIASALSRLKAVGGKDNAAALLEALAIARRKSDSAVVWIHAAQPFLLTDAGLLEQTLERSFTSRPIYSFATEQGPDLVTANLHQHTDLRSAPRGSELGDFLAQLTTKNETSTYRYHLQNIDAPLPAEAEKVWDHLARYWAFTATMQKYRDLRGEAKNTGTPAAAALAAKYQLVTPFSGAVVLETKSDYRVAGLDQVDPNSTPGIPSIPEPGSTSLMIITLTAMLLRRKRKR